MNIFINEQSDLAKLNQKQIEAWKIIMERCKVDYMYWFENFYKRL